MHLCFAFLFFIVYYYWGKPDVKGRMVISQHLNRMHVSSYKRLAAFWFEGSMLVRRAAIVCLLCKIKRRVPLKHWREADGFDVQHIIATVLSVYSLK